MVKKCSKCTQQLRIPTDIGGMVLRCPSCGHEFHTDFKISTDSVENSGSGDDCRPQNSRSQTQSTFRIVV